MKLNMNNAATVAGGGAGLAMIAQVDWEKLATGNLGQIALLLAGLCIVALGAIANRKDPPPPAVPVNKE